jgi:hypothetical protein
MENITIPKNEYNELLSKVNLIDNNIYVEICNIIKDKEFIKKIVYLNKFFNSDVFLTDNEVLLNSSDFQNEINNRRKEVNNGDYVTFDELLKELDYD